MQAIYGLTREKLTSILAIRTKNPQGREFHFHSQIEIAVVNEGRIESWVGDKKYSASAGEHEQTDGLLEGEVIDLNTAGVADLERLPGVGSTRARAIVEHRQEHGAFGSVDDLLKVDGIGPGILEKVRPYVSVK